jgi:hypothetical protein
MHPKKAQFRSWGIFLFCCALGLGYYGWIAGRKANYANIKIPQGEGSADYFLLLRMPEITSQYESGGETMKNRIDEWLDAVVASGFHPMLLSDVMRRLQQNIGVPERTVVFFYSPGYRETIEIVDPIFFRHRCPAVYLTDKSAMKRSDRRYLTFHATRMMKASGRWDVGFVDQKGNFRIEKNEPACWSSIAGALALNRKADFHCLNFLTVNADWDAAELVNRLRAESPANNKSRLGKAVIHSREWGVTLPGTSPQTARFDLQAALNKRGAKLFWLGTLARQNFNIYLSVGSLTGELWLQLRFDEVSGNDVHLIMSGNNLVIEERHDHLNKRLLSIPMQRSFQGGAFVLGVALNDNSVKISIDGRTYKAICQTASSSADKGIVQLFLTDRLRGVARANDIRLIFTPVS